MHDSIATEGNTDTNTAMNPGAATREPRESLANDETERVIVAVLEWANRSPERVVLEMLDGSQITTKDIGQAMEERHGRVFAHILNLIAVGLRYDTLDNILADFDSADSDE